MTQVTISAAWTPYKLMEELHHYFNNFAQNAFRSADESWLEMDGKPVPWYRHVTRTMPVSAILDMFAYDLQVPYTVVLHLRYATLSRNPPADFLKLENQSQLKQMIKSGLKAVVRVSPDWHHHLQQKRCSQEQHEPDRTRQDVEPYTERCHSIIADEIPEYFLVYDKIMHCSFNYDKSMMRVPVNFYVRGASHEISRSVMACLQLGEALLSVFPQLHDSDTHELLPQYSRVKCAVMGYELEWRTPVAYLYECFKCIAIHRRIGGHSASRSVIFNESV